MGWKLLDRPKTLKVTKKLATQFADMDPAPHDRPLSERRLQVYRKILQSGSFRPVTWASALCSETGGLYRVNGKHTSTMLSSMPTIPEFYAVVEEYECDTLEDVARLYATFDSKIQSRTASDINISFAATIPELVGVATRMINLSVSGMSFFLWQPDISKVQPAERAELLLEHPDFVQWMVSIVPCSYKQIGGHLSRGPVIAAMFATWQKSKADAERFWLAVRDETGEKNNLPDRKLARYLLTTSVDSGEGANRIKRASPREMYVKCLHAWNAWRKGEETNLKYYSDADVPVAR